MSNFCFAAFFVFSAVKVFEGSWQIDKDLWPEVKVKPILRVQQTQTLSVLDLEAADIWDRRNLCV